MNKDKIIHLCDEIENTLSDAWNIGAIEYELAGHIVSLAKKIAAEITAPPKSNGDRIRAMTDEELAGVIGLNECKDTAHDYECPAYSIAPECGWACRKHFLAWLKQEVSEDATD